MALASSFVVSSAKAAAPIEAGTKRTRQQHVLVDELAGNGRQLVRAAVVAALEPQPELFVVARSKLGRKKPIKSAEWAAVARELELDFVVRGVIEPSEGGLRLRLVVLSGSDGEPVGDRVLEARTVAGLQRVARENSFELLRPLLLPPPPEPTKVPTAPPAKAETSKAAPTTAPKAEPIPERCALVETSAEASVLRRVLRWEGVSSGALYGHQLSGALQLGGGARVFPFARPGCSVWSRFGLSFAGAALVPVTSRLPDVALSTSGYRVELLAVGRFPLLSPGDTSVELRPAVGWLDRGMQLEGDVVVDARHAGPAAMLEVGARWRWLTGSLAGALALPVLSDQVSERLASSGRFGAELRGAVGFAPVPRLSVLLSGRMTRYTVDFSGPTAVGSAASLVDWSEELGGRVELAF